MSCRRFLFSVAYALSLAACSSPPDLQDGRLLDVSAPAQIKGVHGMLSPTQSAAILAKLKQEGKGSLLERHIAFEEALLGQPLVTGNHVVLLRDGIATYAAMFAAIGQARDHINLETYIFDDDEVGRRFVDLLLKKQAEGVQVNIIYDSVGSVSTPRAFFDRLRNAGVRVLEYNPINPLHVRSQWLVNNRDHRKLLVVDGQTAFLGGVNISKVYSRGSQPFRRKTEDKDHIPWRDTHLQIDGPVVADLQHCFLDTWDRQSGQPLAPRAYFPTVARKGDELVRAIPAVSDNNYSQIYIALLSAIGHATKEVELTNAYFVPDPQFLQTLEDAARRGVDVKLILPGHTDSWIAWQAGRSHYAELLNAGVKVYERRGALLHAKTAVVDGVWSTVGSSNLDWRSFVHNDELNAEILGADFAGQMRTMFAQDLAESDLIEADGWSHRSVVQHVKEWAAQIWSYWL